MGVLHISRHLQKRLCAVVQLNISRSFCVITVSKVPLQTVQFVQYLYNKYNALFCSRTYGSSLSVITLSTVQLQIVEFVQYLYSKCAVLLCS